jgi:peptide deformylase
MVYPIVKFGDRVLEMPAQAVTAFGDNLKTLVTNMFESMYAARGVGLAAPQIGVGKRIAVIDISFQRDPGAKIVLVNPEIIRTEGRQTLEEGCLSIPGFRAKVTPPQTVALRAQDTQGSWFECTGGDLLARAVLHETDHVNGNLFLSHLSALKRASIKRQVRKLIVAGRW